MTNDYLKIQTRENQVRGEMMHFQSRNQNDNNKGENTTVDNRCCCQTQFFPRKKKELQGVRPAQRELKSEGKRSVDTKRCFLMKHC